MKASMDDFKWHYAYKSWCHYHGVEYDESEDPPLFRDELMLDNALYYATQLAFIIQVNYKSLIKYTIRNWR